MTLSYDPIPWFLHQIPQNLLVVDPPAEERELADANRIRQAFRLPNGPGAYMTDIVRAFRLARGARCYIEVGTRDKGNIAWLCPSLDPAATIIDVDLEQIPDAQHRLRKSLPAAVDYHALEGDSISWKTVDAVHGLLGDKLADIIFLDSSHMYSHFLREVALYWQFLKPGGAMLVHDIFWEGNETDKGKAQAADRIDQHVPVYVVAKNDPVTRFFYRSRYLDNWGGVGIILKS
jgi:predicted O-methyltransferase YrrM